MFTTEEHKVTIGTRGSLLARAQTSWVADQLRTFRTDLDIEIRIITTTGDRKSAQPLPEVGGKGLFTLELEQALRAGEIDLAVHSAKDLPTDLADGLAILAAPVREDPRDAFISRGGTPFDDLSPGAVIGTSSLRRRAQLLMLRPDLHFTTLRGNVDTRLRKIERGDCDASILAMAGLIRAGLAASVTQPMDVRLLLPAPGQGVLALQGRADDKRVARLLAPLHHAETAVALHCERRLIARLDTGCLAPVGAYARRDGERLRLEAVVALPDGSRSLRAAGQDEPDAWADLADRVADDLFAEGAAEIIAACRLPERAP